MTRKETNTRRRIVYHLRKAMRDRLQEHNLFDGCVVFQADIHLAATGVDPMKPWRERWKTERGMWRIVGKAGLRGAMIKIARRLGWKRISPMRAKVGDIGIIVGAKSLIAVRCIYRGEWIARSEGGWSIIPTRAVKAAWSIY